MADIRFVRQPSDNKIRNLIPLSPVGTPTRKLNESVPIELFLASRPPYEIKPPIHIQTPFRQDQVMHNQRHGSPKINHHAPDAKIGDKNEPKTDNVDKMAMFNANNDKMSSPQRGVFGNPCADQNELEGQSQSRCKGWSEYASSNTPESEDESDDESTKKIPHRPFRFSTVRSYSSNCFVMNGSNSSNSFMKKTDSSRSFMDLTYSQKAKNCPVMQFCSTFGTVVTDNSNSLMDVHDDELKQLPEVNNPAGVFASPKKLSTSNAGEKESRPTSPKQSTTSNAGEKESRHITPKQSASDEGEKKGSPFSPQQSSNEANKSTTNSQVKSSNSPAINHLNNNHPYNKQNGEPDNNIMINRQQPARRVLKKSVSSFDLDEAPYTSFFGSLCKKRAPFLAENEDECEYDSDGPDDNNFTSLWGLRRPWHFESTFHRTKSVDSFMPSGKKMRQVSPIESLPSNQSQTPVERLTSNTDDEDSGDEGETEKEADRRNKKVIPSYHCDRLRMRRGALAQPEQMIMSQAVRENIQRDVGKRKASMVRKMSQFLNVQLGLNREEDLI